MGRKALTAKDKLSLEGVGIILTILMAVAASIVWMENRYVQKSDIRALRCDVYMLHLSALETSPNKIQQQRLVDQLERKWSQICGSPRNFGS